MFAELLAVDGQPIVSDISQVEQEVASLSDEQLRGLTGEFPQKLE